MSKKSVNLIISSKPESDLLKKAKVYLPVISATVFIIFLFLYIYSFLQLNSKKGEAVKLANQIKQLENSISKDRDIEGIYTVTLGRLNLIDQLLTNGNEYVKLIKEIDSVNFPGVKLSPVGIDSKGNVNMTVSASSSASLEKLVEKLLAKDEDQKKFIQVFSQGISRDKKGVYNLNISFISDKSLLK